MARNSNRAAERKVQRWAKKVEKLAAIPIDEPTKHAVAEFLVVSAGERMERAVDPEGTPHPPLSRGYAARKRKSRGHAKIWLLTGQSRQRIEATVTGDRAVITINTRYSGVVHDGASWTAYSTARGREARGKVQARNRRRHVAKLRKAYGEKGRGATERARAKHAASLREGAAARRRGHAELLPQYRRTRSAKSKGARVGRHSKLFWTVTIPARRVLGVSDGDAKVIAKIVLNATGERLEE